MVTEAGIRELNRQSESDVILAVALPMVEFVAPVVEEMPLGPEEMPLAPERFTLGSLRDGRLRVTASIEVVQMMEGSEYVVEALDLNEFGFGDSLSEAIADLQAAIAELYLTLEAEQERLGPDLASVWGVLSRKVRRADATSRP